MATPTTRTYCGPLRRGRVQLGDRRPPFTRGVPLEVDAAEDELLDADPDWGGTAVEVLERPGPGAVLPPPDGEAHWSDPRLDPLDKAALLEFADEHELTVNRRLGEARLRQAIADALHANDHQGDQPENQEP